MTKVAIIGCGNIGSQVAQFIDKNYKDKLSINYLVDIDEANILSLQNILINNSPKQSNLAVAIKDADLIIECAHPSVVCDILDYENFDCGKKFIFASTGGLFNCINRIDNLSKTKIYYPSGAIAGLDALKAVRNNITSLSLTTTKNPKGLGGAPFIIKNDIKINKEKKEEIFSGKLSEAIKGFPRNINVAATLFLITRFDNINVTIISDPNTSDNTHQIICKGDFGEIEAITRNKPSINPKTSQLAIYSIFDLISGVIKN